MGRDPVKVCVRTRPTAIFAQEVIAIDKEAQARDLHFPRKVFCFNHGLLQSRTSKIFLEEVPAGR